MYRSMFSSVQGVNCSQKFCGKCGFPNLVNGRAFQFVSQILTRVPKR